MPDRTRYDCLRCDRSFLTRAALDRHYDRNPEHAERFVIDADAVAADATTLPGGEWIETDETVETFVALAEPVSASDDAAGSGASAPPDEPSASGESPAGDSPDAEAPPSAEDVPDPPASVEMTYDPAGERLVIHGIRDRELDLSEFWEAVDDRLTWSFDGTYHKLQFHKADDES